MQGFIQEDLIAQDVYINTFSQKVSGSDTDFIVTTGQAINNIKALELNTFRMVNFLTNFDQGFSQDFRDFSFEANGVIYKPQATQYYQSIGSFFSWLNTQISPLTVSYSTDSIFAYLLNNLQFQNNGVPQTFKLIGAGWEKLGFATQTTQNSLNSTSAYDLSQSCMINLYFDSVPYGVSCSQGAITFTVANTSSFGSVLTFESTQKAGNKTVFFQQPISLPSQLHIQLQNEEQRQLTTVQGRNPAVNQTGLECIIVLKAWVKPQ